MGAAGRGDSPGSSSRLSRRTTQLLRGLPWEHAAVFVVASILAWFLCAPLLASGTTTATHSGDTIAGSKLTVLLKGARKPIQLTVSWAAATSARNGPVLTVEMGPAASLGTAQMNLIPQTAALNEALTSCDLTPKEPLPQRDWGYSNAWTESATDPNKHFWVYRMSSETFPAQIHPYASLTMTCHFRTDPFYGHVPPLTQTNRPGLTLTGMPRGSKGCIHLPNSESNTSPEQCQLASSSKYEMSVPGASNNDVSPTEQINRERRMLVAGVVLGVVGATATELLLAILRGLRRPAPPESQDEPAATDGSCDHFMRTGEGDASFGRDPRTQ